MKTILKIFAILAVTILVAGGIYLLVENTSIVSNISGGERSELAAGERAEISEGNKRGERGEGDHHNETSLTQGLAETGKVIAKIGLITTLVLSIQFLFNKFNILKKAKTAA